MKKWQKEHIRVNKPKLIRNTKCSPGLLSILESKNILGEDDLDLLKAEKRKGKRAQAALFYEITVTRTNAYPELFIALNETQQTGARDVLKDGYVSRELSPPICDHISSTNTGHLDEVKSKTVNVQGQKVLLDKVCKHIHSDTLNVLIQDAIDTRDAFLDDKDSTLICVTLPAKVEHYVQRRLKKRSRLDVNVLQKASTDIFLVQGIKLHQFTKLAYPYLVDQFGSQLENIAVRHISCETYEDFEAICQKRPETSIHFLNYDQDGLYWVETKGNIKIIQQYVHENQNEMEEKTLVRNLLANYSKCQPICISDRPGMGKTMLLRNIVHKIIGARQDTLAFYFVLREFLQLLPTSREVTADNIRELIVSLVTPPGATTFATKVVHQLLVSPKQKVELFFDGYDEILDEQANTCKTMLKIICSKFFNTRLYVSTRPHMLQQLEETLGVLGYNMLPFDETNQIDYLVSYWTLQENIPSNDGEVLRAFAKRCLDNLRIEVVDKKLDIAGVPLQCRLLGEIYQTQIKRLVHSPTSANVLPVKSLYQMYNNLMQLRFEKDRERQKVREKSQSRANEFLNCCGKEKPQTLQMREVHYLCAVNLLFPEFINLFKIIVDLDHCDLIKYLKSRDVYDLGILETTNMFSEQCRFAHRTFAEFLFAELLVKIITSEYRIRRDDKSGAPFLNFLFHHAFKTQATYQCMLPTELPGITSEVIVDNFVSPVITYFINAHLNGKRYKKINLFDIYKKYIAKVPTFDSRSTFNQIFVSCAAANLTNLFDLLVQLWKTTRMGPLVTSVKLAVAAARFADFGFNRALYSLISDTDLNSLYTECRDKGFVTPVQVAAQRGDYGIVQVIVSKRFARKNVLHACVAGSHFDTYSTICSKIEIMKLILDEDEGHLIHERLDADDSTPILQSCTDKNLVEWLLKNGADIRAITIDFENILHKFLQTAGDNKLQEETLVEWLVLLRKYRFCDYNRRNAKGDLPIALALSSIKLTGQSLKLFHENRVDYSIENDNLLFVAITYRQSVECLQYLVTNGAKVLSMNTNGASVLHAAVDSGHIDAVKFLLCNKAVSTKLIQSKDHQENTPLHIAYAKNDEVHSEIQNILTESGANLSSENESGQTPLEYGLENSITLAVTVNKLHYLEGKGYTLSSEIANCLLRAILMNKAVFKLNRDFRELLRYLILLGGEIKCKNGRSLMETRTMKNCLKRISQNMSHNRLFEGQIKKDVQHVFDKIIETKLTEQDKLDYFKITQNKYCIESVITLILFLKDHQSFRRLQIAYQLIESGLIRHTTISNKLIDFFELPESSISVIFTDNIFFTVYKIQNVIDPSILVVDFSIFSRILTDQESSVAVIVPESLIPVFLQNHKDTTRRIICICICYNRNYIKNNICRLNIPYFEDKYVWEKLSTELQNELLERFSKYKRQSENSFDFGLQDLSLCEILTSDILPIDFLIPHQVRNNVTGLFSDNAANPAPYENALGEYAFQQLFPRIKYSSNFSAEDITEEQKQLVLYGPTASCLAAFFISRNFKQVHKGDEQFIYELFSTNSLPQINDHLGKTTPMVETYDFKNYLVLYYLNKWNVTSKNRNVVQSFNKEEELVHGCVRMHAPKLLNLFKYEFPLSPEAYTIASIQGNVHVFDQPGIQLGNHYALLDNVHLIKLAVKNRYLEDIFYITRNSEILKACGSEMCSSLIHSCMDNTFRDDEQLVLRKLFALKCLIKNCADAKQYFADCTHFVIKTHPKLLNGVINTMHERYSMFGWRMPENFVSVISTYMNESEICNIIQYALKRSQYHLLLTLSNRLRDSISNILTEEVFNSMCEKASHYDTNLRCKVSTC